MAVKTLELYFEKPVEDLYILDITKSIQKSVDDCRIRNGITTVFIGCTTASISTMKHDPNGVKQMHDALERLAPTDVLRFLDDFISPSRLWVSVKIRLRF